MDQLILSWSKTPLKLIDDRVWRTYAGGASLDTWKHNPDPQDSDFPELWIASTVQAVNSGRKDLPAEGLSKVDLAGYPSMTLKELIGMDPSLFLGAQHAERYQTSPGILVKLLDSSERLTIQVHPDQQFALKEFNSRFGKTEAWYILEGRTIDGEKPYVLLGFKPEVTPDSWRRMFEEQDIPGMLNALHKVYVQPGDVFLIKGGLPHAIGSGCFLIEIQEPTDLTLRTERTTPRGVQLMDHACHQGIGFERMLQCFHYEPAGLEETLSRSKVTPEIVRETTGGKETSLIQAGHTDRFRMSRLNVTASYPYEKQDEFAAAIVVSGSGRLIYGDQLEMELKQGETYFLPAGLRTMIWTSNSNSADEQLVVVLCYPPL